MCANTGGVNLQGNEAVKDWQASSSYRPGDAKRVWSRETDRKSRQQSTSGDVMARHAGRPSSALRQTLYRCHRRGLPVDTVWHLSVSYFHLTFSYERIQPAQLSRISASLPDAAAPEAAALNAW